MSLESIWRALGESNTERNVTISAGVSKEGTWQYIYYQITKFEDEGSKSLGGTN